MKMLTSGMTNVQIAEVFGLDPETCYGVDVSDVNGIHVTKVKSINLNTGEFVVYNDSSIADRGAPILFQDSEPETVLVKLDMFEVSLYTRSGMTASHRLSFHFERPQNEIKE